MTPEERAAALRNITFGMWALGIAGLVAVVFGVVAKATSLGSAQALSKVNLNVMIIGGGMGLVMAAGLYVIIRASNIRNR
jgi:hypothetical protein